MRSCISEAYLLRIVDGLRPLRAAPGAHGSERYVEVDQHIRCGVPPEPGDAGVLLCDGVRVIAMAAKRADERGLPCRAVPDDRNPQSSLLRLSAMLIHRGGAG